MTDAWEPRIAPAPERAKSTGFPIGLTVVTAIALAILLSLGVWQLYRLKWKESLLAHVAQLERSRPVTLDRPLHALERGENVEFTRVSVDCPGLASAPFLELYDLRDGEAGARLVSACPVAIGAFRTILVDRGYIPDTSKARPTVDPNDKTPVRLEGVLRRPERGNFATPKSGPGHWYLHDVAGMAKALGASAPAPVFLFAETRVNPGLAALTPAPMPVEIPNRHFEYALTWFALAGALAGVYVAFLFRRLKG